MAVHRTHKLLSSEKRLQLLQTQLYGKTDENPTANIQPQYPSSRIQHPSSKTDITYLKHDLTKIALLTTLAIGIQLLIYFGSRSNLLRLF